MVLKSNPMYCQGIVAMSPDLGFYKLTSPIYSYLASLRGNESNLKVRYLQLRKTCQADFRFNDFCRLYSEHKFQLIEELIRRVARNIHTAYIRRFVKKQFAVVPPEQYEVLKKCHELYNTTKEPITLNTVLDMVNNEPTPSLLRMITASM